MISTIMNAWNVPASRVPFNDEQIRECTHPIGIRPSQCLFFHQSKNITVRGIRVIDAPCWTFTFSECENVKLTCLTIDTDLTIPNNDGIHLSASRDVIISDCHISSGDDCIAVTSITNWAKPCEDYMLITNCIIKESNRGLCIMCNDQSSLVENVRVNNMRIDTRIRAGNWWGNGEPILIMALKHDQWIPADQHPHHQTECSVRNIHIDGITCTAENAMGIYGAEGCIREVSLQNIDYTRKSSANIALKGYAFDFAPACVDVDVPVDCGLYIGSYVEVLLDRLIL